MLHSLKSGIIGALLVCSGSACAGEAETLLFADWPIERFQLLEPGAAEIPRHERPVPEPLSARLTAAFHELQNPVIEQAPFPSEVDGLHIPTWMKSKFPNHYVKPNLSEYRTFEPNDCAGTQFSPHPSLGVRSQRRRAAYFRQMVSAACNAGVPVALFDALVTQESRYNPRARSHAGATGMAQLMPGTAKYLNVVNIWDIDENLRGGARYLREQLDTFGSWELALAAYNAGPGNVRKHRGVPPFRETRNYVRVILTSIAQSRRSQMARSTFSNHSPQRINQASLIQF